MPNASVLIDAATHEAVKRLAADMHTTEGQIVTLAVRAFRQARIGADLRSDLRRDEVAWLDAGLG